MPNSIDFYKGIFVHVIPFRIIVPCSDLDNILYSALQTPFSNFSIKFTRNIESATDELIIERHASV